MRVILVSILLLAFSFVLATPTSAATIKAAAIDWCPQICPNQDTDGYIIDMVEAVFNDSPFKLSIDYYPWSRAIKGVTNGTLHVLLSPAKKEAPHLFYPDNPVGYQQMCFFTDKDSKWQYENAESLKTQKIGIAQDTSIEELNSKVKEYGDVFQVQPYHERFIEQNARKVLKKRIDSFIFTKNSTIHTLKQLGMGDKFRIAGCVSKVPVYAAFTAKTIENVDKKALLLFFDEKMTYLESNGTISTIKSTYGVE